jgi:Zn-dependent peptidase ImmA (M78 family)
MDELEIEYYDIVDDKALQIRIDYNLFGNNIDIYSLCKKMGLVLVKYSSLNYEQLTIIANKYCLNDVLTITKNNSNYIFYNDNIIESRTRFSLAHEIDHITDTIHPSNKYKEKIADHFARSLLIPKCVLIYENYNDPYKVVADFNVSYSAATYALESALRWKNHPKFKYTEKEIEFLKLYKKYNEEK